MTQITPTGGLTNLVIGDGGPWRVLVVDDEETIRLALAKFLLDCRKDGTEYDQSHLPVQQQYEAVGHAVRAVYTYSGMARRILGSGSRLLISASANLGYRFYAYNLDRFYTCDWQLALRT